ncbi:MAG: metallophosphoesterase family protein [Clostridiales bacterium]|nr:metallophosphoesterase family protein [Clostridiales bacterium]
MNLSGQVRILLTVSPVIWALILIAALGIICFIAMMIYASCVRVSAEDIKISDSSSNAPSPDPLVLGFFSDSHGKGCPKSPEFIANTFIENGCEAVLFGGDCVHSHTLHPSDLVILTEVTRLLKEKGIKLYAVYGNHDQQMKEEDYARMGVILLKDSWQTIRLGDKEFALCGLFDSGRDDRVWPTLPEDFTRYEGFRLLLVHNPDFLYSLPDLTGSTDPRPFDYMLSGHLHGGQVHLPGNLEFKLLRFDRIAREGKVTGGPITFRGYKGYVSNGIGTGALPIRFRARAEINIMKFHF